jgi:hypothetical protein
MIDFHVWEARKAAQKRKATSSRQKCSAVADHVGGRADLSVDKL